jgi:anti-sigma B factor antagonist
VAELEENDGAQLEVEPGADADGQPVLRVSGDLDISSVEDLRGAVEQATASRPQRLTFDLAALRFMDSAGIAVLLGAAKQVPSVRLHRPTDAVRRVVELTGLSDVLVVEP